MPRPAGRPVPYLHAWRERKLIEVTELCAKTDLSRAAISRIERGEPASYKSIKIIAGALGITTDELLYIDPKTEPLALQRSR